MSEAKHIDLPLMTERLSAALRRRADRTNVSGWIAEHADAIGADEATFKKWFYGQGTPSAHHFVRLLHHFGLAFTAEVTGLRLESDERARAQLAELLEQQATLLRNGAS